MRAVLRRGVLVLAASIALPWASMAPAAAAGDASTTILVLDVSGSMDDPAEIPPGFPQAAKLQADENALGRLVELAHPGQKVPLSVIAGGLMGLPELLQLRSQLDQYLQQQNIDPASISKLAALKAAATALLTAIQFERDHAGADDRVGIVTFSSDSAVVAPPTPQVGALTSGVQGLQTDGSTNMGAGLQSALGLLKDQPGPSIILMTDGWNNDGMTNDQVLGGPVQQAVVGKIPVCSIGLGETPADVDQRLLIDIATRTGGGYHFVAGGSPLGGDLLACHQSLSGLSLADLTGSVHQGQVASSAGFTVPAGHHRLTVTLSWPGSQLDLRVTDPTGKPVGAGYPGASITRGAGVAVLTVTNPAAGHWGLGVAGVQVAAAGEPFAASASTDGATSSPHRDLLVGAGLAPLDATEQRLMLARTVSAVIAVALVALWLLGLITRPFRRRAQRGTVAAVAGPPPGYGQAAGQYPPPAYPPASTPPGYPPAPAQPGYPPGGHPPTGYPPQPPAPAQGAMGSGYTPPPPSGYAVSPGQPAYSGPVQYSGRPSTPPRRRSQTGACLGCLLWLVFVVDVLVLGSSAAALYLWTTPLLTFPG